MKKTTWVCPECDELKPLSNRVEIREEHREKPGDGRRHVIKLRDVCRECSDRREQELRPLKTNMPKGYDELFAKGADTRR